MRGLSVTAIGQRELSECLAIYDTLKEKLSLEFLELAVGTRCDLTEIPTEISLVIHHRCLFDGLYKIPFSLAEPDTWKEYQKGLSDRLVRIVSVHPPKRTEISLDDLKRNRDNLESLLGVPVCLEVMPNDSYWLSEEDFRATPERISDIPILLDVSHVNIWARGCAAIAKEWTAKLLPQALAVHLTHNNGRRDSHDLIPSTIWFNDHIDKWESQGLILTYESLPEGYAKYERLDKQRTKQRKRQKQLKR